MGARGRKSSAESAVIQLVPREPPPAPAELTPAQAKLWRQTVRNFAPDYFDTCLPLLIAYIRALSAASFIAKVVDGESKGDLDDDAVKRLNRLHAMAARQSSLAAHLATKLRIANQSRYTPSKAKLAVTPIMKPWDYKGRES